MGRYILTIGLILAALAVGLTLAQRRMRRMQVAVRPAASDVEQKVQVVPSIRGKAAPAFELPDLKGAKVHAADFKNKVLLVNFWATWCALHRRDSLVRRISKQVRAAGTPGHRHLAG